MELFIAYTDDPVTVTLSRCVCCWLYGFSARVRTSQLVLASYKTDAICDLSEPANERLLAKSIFRVQNARASNWCVTLRVMWRECWQRRLWCCSRPAGYMDAGDENKRRACELAMNWCSYAWWGETDRQTHRQTESSAQSSLVDKRALREWWMQNRGTLQSDSIVLMKDLFEFDNWTSFVESLLCLMLLKKRRM